MNWRHRIAVKHLFTEKEDHESIQTSMNAIADALCKQPCFIGFCDLPRFRSIPVGDDVFGPKDYANRLLDAMYDFGDKNRIWID